MIKKELSSLNSVVIGSWHPEEAKIMRDERV
jgi:hypothetical protein